MLKRERGAGRSASRKTNVDDMQEWRVARGSRASSERHPHEESRDDLPFWEQDNPFGARGKERQPREQQHWDAGQFRRESRQGRQPDDEGRRHEFVQQQNGQWQPAARESRQHNEQDRSSSRPESGRPAPEIDLREFRDARSRSRRNDTRQDDVQRSKGNERYQPDDDAPVSRKTGREPQEDEISQRRERAGQTKAQPAARNGRHNMLLLVMALLGLAAIAVIIGLKVFEIRGIEVKGNDSVSAQSIIALSGINIGENILKADLGQAKNNIESDPLLQVLSISRVYPDRITIEVRQRKPHGAIAYLGAYIIIDENGFVLDVRDSLPAGQYPLITGVEIQPSEKGKPLVGVDGVQQKTMYSLLKALYDNNAMQYISEANLGNGGDIRLLTGEGLQIDLGKPTGLDQKAQWIACSVPELRMRGYTSGVLHITGTGSPVYSETDSSQTGQNDGTDTAGEQDAGDETSEDDTSAQAGEPDNAA